MESYATSTRGSRHVHVGDRHLCKVQDGGHRRREGTKTLPRLEEWFVPGFETLPPGMADTKPVILDSLLVTLLAVPSTIMDCTFFWSVCKPGGARTHHDAGRSLPAAAPSSSRNLATACDARCTHLALEYMLHLGELAAHGSKHSAELVQLVLQDAACIPSLAHQGCCMAAAFLRFPEPVLKCFQRRLNRNTDIQWGIGHPGHGCHG